MGNLERNPIDSIRIEGLPAVKKIGGGSEPDYTGPSSLKSYREGKAKEKLEKTQNNPPMTEEEMKATGTIMRNKWWNKSEEERQKEKEEEEFEKMITQGRRFLTEKRRKKQELAGALEDVRNILKENIYPTKPETISRIDAEKSLNENEEFLKFKNALKKNNEFNLEDLSQTEKESLALIEEKIKQARVESKTHKEAEEKFSEIINNTPTQEVINVLLGGNLSTYEVNTILRAKKDDPEILAAASIHKPAEVLSVLTQSDSEFSSEVIDTILENKPSILKTLDLDIQETIISNNPEYFIFADNRVQENYLNQNPEFLNTLKEKDKEEIINYLYSKNKDYDALSPILEKLSNSNQILEKLHPKKRLRMKIKLSNRNILRDRSALIESIQSGRINELDIIMGIDRNPDIKEDIYKTLKSINPKYYERLVNKAQKLFSFVGLPAEEQADLLEKGILEEKEILNYLSPAIYDKLLKPLREVQEKRRYFFHNIPGSIDMDKSTQPNLPTTIKNK